MGLGLAKQRPVSNRNITDQDCFPGRQRGDDRWILCFKSLMLGAQTQSKRMDSVCLLSNFSCKDASHIVIINTLLFTITLIPKNKQKTIILKQGVFSVHLSFWKRMQHECIVKQIMQRLHISILFQKSCPCNAETESVMIRLYLFIYFFKKMTDFCHILTSVKCAADI